MKKTATGKALSSVSTKRGCRCEFRCNLEAKLGSEERWIITYCPLHTAAPEMLALIVKLTGVVEDFMPNLGKCVLQNYQALNDSLCESAAIQKKVATKP